MRKTYSILNDKIAPKGRLNLPYKQKPRFLVPLNRTVLINLLKDEQSKEYLYKESDGNKSKDNSEVGKAQ